MKIYLVKNSNYRQWVVCAESEEKAKTLIPAKQLEPFLIGYPFGGQPTEPYSEVTVEEVKLDTYKILLDTFSDLVWF